MELITKNTIRELYQTAESFRLQPHDSWKCIYLKLSDKTGDFNHQIYASFIVKALAELLADKEGTIYVCSDKDIFIMFQGALKPMFNSLSSHFGDYDLNQISVLSRGNLLNIFNLKTDWDDFYELCEGKYLRALAASENARSNWNSYVPAAASV